MNVARTSTTELAGHWVCMGVPPHTPPCGARGSDTQAKADKAAEKHTESTGHSTMTGTRPMAR